MAKPSVGKYVKALAGKPVHLGTEPSYQDRVEKMKQELRAQLPNLYASTFAHAYSVIRDDIKDIEGDLSAENLKLMAITQMLVEQFDVEGITSLKLDSGGSVRVQVEPYVKVEDRAALQKWCIDNGLLESLQLPWASLSSITKERLMDGEPEPAGTSVWVNNKAVYTAGKE